MGRLAPGVLFSSAKEHRESFALLCWRTSRAKDDMPLGKKKSPAEAGLFC
jgi:hypothetical protein